MSLYVLRLCKELKYINYNLLNKLNIYFNTDVKSDFKNFFVHL